MSFDGTLAAWLREQPGLLSLQTVAYIVRRAADALQQVHDQQITYQDVNPSSFLIHAYGENAERLDLQLADSNTITYVPTRSSGSYPTSSLFVYMAPEQWVGQAVPATNQYALAIMAYELLTGQPPFQGPPAQLMDLHINVQPPAPSTLNQRVSPAIDAVILGALAKRPEDRFPSVSAFARALEQAVRYPESLIVSVPRTTIDGNLRATLRVSRAEAAIGTLRTITLPQGRHVTVSVPAGAQDGQIIRLEGFGDPSPTGGSAGAVLLAIEITQTETSILTADLAKQTKKLPLSATLTLDHSKVLASRAYTAVANLPPRSRALSLASLALILVLGGAGLFSLLRSSSVSIPYPPHRGSLALNDLLRDNGGGYSWPDGTSSDGGTCQFTQGAYHINMTQAGSFHYCIAGVTGFSNFVYEVRMTIVKGDEGGIIFRADGNNGKFYYFRVGRDGSYGLYLYVDTVGTHSQTLTNGITPAVRTGLNISNLLAVVANGSTIDLYVNNQHIASVNNNTYGSGQVGVAAAYDTDLTEVIFSNARVWTL